MDYQNLKNLAIAEKSRLDVISEEYTQSKSDLEKFIEEHKTLNESIQLYDSSIEVFKSCVVKLSEKHILHLQELVNSMLRTIFYDKQLEIKFEIEDQRNTKILNIYVEEQTNEGPVLTEILANGGGLQTLVGFTLQVYFLLYFEQAPIMFLDEALSAISADYLPGLMDFMKSLVEKYNFIFCAVFHDVRFDEYSDVVYQINNGCAKRVR